ncbi:lipoyl(octanoyl) transferase LipB [Streptomyces regalis]|uniref:Octanoyltransferase n=1 Tax=Streptomyces regalis TaxID=68262 RepID=A0A0X3V5V6_9ACTN|nr:lipoyl(octanoyl) transferase LipB [Streptomyces regalis]KUL40183.1 octanoyltransferase [Streptomyces regalis]
MGSANLEAIDLGEVPYEVAQADMARWVTERKEGRAGNRLFLLTHPPVITYTARTPVSQLPDPSAPIPLVEVDRGGHATYHGPGQLIGYLVVNVRDLGPRGLVRRVEHALIHAVGSLGFEAVRRDTPRGSESLVGVWTPDHRKLASIGMRISGSVTSHGFALNIAPDLDVYSTFMSCALPDVRMTSLAELAEEIGRPTPTEAQVRDAVTAALTTKLSAARGTAVAAGDHAGDGR